MCDKRRLRHFSFFFFLCGCTLAPSWDAFESVKPPRKGGRPGLVRGAEPESGGEERKQGSEREHMRSPAYYSCTDGAADETGGMDG